MMSETSSLRYSICIERHDTMPAYNTDKCHNMGSATFISHSTTTFEEYVMIVEHHSDLCAIDMLADCVCLF
jgi:translation initiation factor RLI1